METTLRVSTEVLDWAAAQVGTTLREFARQISRRSADKIIEGTITGSQAVKIAKKAGIPLGYLFLEKAPAPRTLPIADFRTIRHAKPLGKDYYAIYDDIEQKQTFYRDHLIATGVAPRGFVGRFRGRQVPAAQVAADIRKVLGYSGAHALKIEKPEDLFSELAALSEAAGILVFKNGVVANNTRRALSVQEFRGFCVSDEYAPVIFVNGKDAPAAWVFTLAHELAHIWMGDSGISDAAPNSKNEQERFCNAVAAEFLVPEQEFRDTWKATVGDAATKIERVRRHFRVSGLVIALRALHLDLISQATYDAVYEEAKRHRARDTDGGDFYRTLAVRNSKAFSRRVADLAVSGAITLREAGDLLNINPNYVTAFHARQP
jgi:Zn-dependent peptidase ImmA (M78 family)